MIWKQSTQRFDAQLGATHCIPEEKSLNSRNNNAGCSDATTSTSVTRAPRRTRNKKLICIQVCCVCVCIHSWRRVVVAFSVIVFIYIVLLILEFGYSLRHRHSLKARSVRGGERSVAACSKTIIGVLSPTIRGVLLTDWR